MKSNDNRSQLGAKGIAENNFYLLRGGVAGPGIRKRVRGEGRKDFELEDGWMNRFFVTAVRKLFSNLKAKKDRLSEGTFRGQKEPRKEGGKDPNTEKSLCQKGSPYKDWIGKE